MAAFNPTVNVSNQNEAFDCSSLSPIFFNFEFRNRLSVSTFSPCQQPSKHNSVVITLVAIKLIILSRVFEFWMAEFVDSK